jgi:hypothetical protein
MLHFEKATNTCRKGVLECPARRRPSIKLWLLPCAFSAVVWGQSNIQITSPANGTVVAPDQLLKVTVRASGKFTEVFVMGEKPIGISAPLSVPPYEFTFHLPDDIASGGYSLTATGIIAPGQRTSSLITLEVEEPDDAPIKLKVDFKSLELLLGGKGYINLEGIFPDGRRVDLNHSIHTSFRSNASEIARVEPHQGIITGMALGSTKIIVAYRKDHVEVPVTVVAKRQ